MMAASRRLTARLLVALACGALAMAAASPARAEPRTLKLATLAPEGSSWMNVFHEWGAEIEKKSGGAIKAKFYAGGVAGDERDAVRKMRLGQINGAALTAVGLGLIQPQSRALELPFMFRSPEEMDHVRETLAAEFRKMFEEKGYVLLAWGDVGPVHIFTNVPVKSKADLQGAKLWAWHDDPVIRTFFQNLGLTVVALGVPDVLPSLQTGVVNACYGSPLSTVALQWHSKIRYIMSLTISQAVGAVVMSKKAWDELSPAEQKLVMDESKVLEQRLLKTVRADNAAALDKMKAQGIQVVETPQALVDEFHKVGMDVRAQLEGQLYTPALRGRIEGLLNTKRGGK